MADHKKYVLSYFLNISKNRELSEGLTGLAVYKHISGGESILEAGHRTDHICLVVSGLVRGFYIDEEGNDRTKCFSLQGDWCCSYNYLSEDPCPFFLEAEQDSVLAMFHIPDIAKIKEKFPIYERMVCVFSPNDCTGNSEKKSRREGRGPKIHSLMMTDF